MLNLFKSEWYQLTHRKAPIGWLIFGALTGIMTILLPFIGSKDTEFPFDVTVFIQTLPEVYPMVMVTAAPFLIVGLQSAAFNNELKNRTLINALSYGYSRTAIYLTKFISAVVLSTMFVFTSLVFLNAACLVMFGFTLDEGNTAILAVVAGYFPIWTAYISFFLLASFKSDTPAPGYAAMAFIFIVLPLFLQVTSPFFPVIQAIRPYIFTELQPASLGNFLGISLATWSGLLHTLAFLAIGIYFFNKSEVK